MARVSVPTTGSVTVGPYSPAVYAHGVLFLSGQTPVDPATGKLVTGDIQAQTRQCLDNLTAVLTAAGLSRDDVVKCNVFLADMADFADMNAAYAAYFSEPLPARTTVAVAGLPLGARVEIEMVAQARDPA